MVIVPKIDKGDPRPALSGTPPHTNALQNRFPQ